jgi:hypothetical protein
MGSILHIPIAENNGKTSPCAIQIAAAAADTDLAAYIVKLDTVVLGTITKPRKHLAIAGVTDSAAQAGFGAQRGQKWLHSGTGADGKVYTFSAPTADSGQLTTVGSDMIALTSGLWPAYKTALQLIWKDDAGTSVTLNTVSYRNYNLQ